MRCLFVRCLEESLYTGSKVQELVLLFFTRQFVFHEHKSSLNNQQWVWKRLVLRYTTHRICQEHTLVARKLSDRFHSWTVGVDLHVGFCRKRFRHKWNKTSRTTSELKWIFTALIITTSKSEITFCGCCLTSQQIIISLRIFSNKFLHKCVWYCYYGFDALMCLHNWSHNSKKLK